MPDPSEFRFERDLLAVLRQNSPGALNIHHNRVRVLSEIQIGTCIPDLVIVCSRRGYPRVPPRLSYFDCTIVAATMRAGVTTIETLADTTFSPPTEIARRVSRLVRIGLLDEKGDSQVRLAPKVLSNKMRIVAVEAKLTRWKDALAQARAYLSFANEAYIAMPASAVRRNATALAACADAGVGVFAVDDVDVSVVLTAERGDPVSAEWVRVVSSAVGFPQMRTTFSSNASCHPR